MPEPILRIPIDDEAFQRYLATFNKYQEALREQPAMWEGTNERVLENVSSNMMLAEAIGQQISAALRLGDVEARNTARKRKDAEDTESENQRAQSWRQRALNHVEELSRSSAKVVRGLGDLASGKGGTGGLFGAVEDMGKGIGGTLGGIVNLVGHALNAGYDMNKSISDRQQQAVGIGASSIGQMEGFQNYVGKFVDSNTGIDATTNALGDPSMWGAFARLGIKQRKGEDAASVYSRIIRRSVDVGEANTDANGNVRQDIAGAKGAYGFLSPEDLRRLIARDKIGMLNTDLAKSLSSQKSNPLTNDVGQASTTLTQKMDNLATTVFDTAASFGTNFNPALDAAVKGLQDLANVAEKIVSYFPASWNPKSAIPTVTQLTPAQIAARDKADAADPNQPRGKGLLGGLKAMWNSPWLSLHNANDNQPPSMSGHAAAGAALGAGARGTVAQVAAGLMANGIGQTQALGAAAGNYAESKGDPNALGPIVQQGRYKGQRAFGIGQWLGERKDRLFAMARADHVDPHDLKEQIKFLAWELKGGDSGGKAVTSASSIEAALEAYIVKFMRPHSGAETTGDISRAQAVVRAMQNQKAKVAVTVHDKTGGSVNVTANSAARA